MKFNLLDNSLFRNHYNKVRFVFTFLSLMFFCSFGNIYAEKSSENKGDLILQQQAKELKGIVTDDQGEPLQGVSVSVKGTSVGVMTGVNGEYAISVSNSSVVRFSYLGFVPQEKLVGSETTINIMLQEDVQLLEEVVVIGYGSIKQKDLTSSIQTVKNKDMLSGAFNTPLEMINGKVAGVSVSSTAPGDPNQTSNVQIRGASSLSAGNGPLIIIDGVPGADLRSIAPQDIESITTLRDGAAAAIYGSRAANGVMLVETKKGKFGKSGKVSLSYEGYLDFESISARPDLLSAEEYLAHKRGPNNGTVTDWYDALINKDNFGQFHYLSLTSGGENSTLRISGSYREKDAIDIASTRQDYGLKASFGQRVFDGVLEFNGNVSYKAVNEGYTDYDAFKMAVKLNPTTPIYNDKEASGYTRFYGYDEYNPVQRLKERARDAYNDYSMIDLGVKLNATKELNTELKASRFGQNKNYKYYETAKDLNSIQNERIGWAKQEYENWTNWTLEWLVNYNKKIDKHSISVMGGYSYEEKNWKKFGAENGKFPSDAYTYNNMGAGDWQNEKGRNGMWSEKKKSKLIAFFGRVNYAFDDAYLLAATLRYEGSTKFGKDNKWGYFPSVSAAWRFSKLGAFERMDFVDDLKFRVSYGSTGRQGFDEYTSLAKYNGYGRYMNDAGQWIQAYGPGNNDNPYLRWEKQHSYNIGLDWTLFGSRLSGALDVFTRIGQDMISDYDVPVPPYLHDKITTNVATSKANGVEVSVDYNVINTPTFNYTTNLRFSYVKSILDEFSDGTFKRGYMTRYDLPSPGNPGPAMRLEDGVEIGSFYGYRYAGVDDAGNIMIWKGAKVGGEKIVGTQGNDNDKDYIGTGAPKIQWSWGNNFKYKNFDLSMFFTSRMSYSILNLYQMYYGLQGEPQVNLLRDAYTRNGQIKSGKVMCDYFLENGNYFRLENLTLGYSPKINWKYLSNLRIYGTVRNLFTLTNYTGLDPANVDVNGLEPGIGKLDAYPVTRTFTFGLQVTF